MPSTNGDQAETKDFGLAIDHEAHLEDITVNFVTINETHSLKDALAGLPDGQCQCPHWGYMIKGRITVDYGNRTENYGPGDAFYMTAGHVPTAEAGSEFVQFSPKDELAATKKAVEEHMRRVASHADSS